MAAIGQVPKFGAEIAPSYSGPQPCRLNPMKFSCGANIPAGVERSEATAGPRADSYNSSLGGALRIASASQSIARLDDVVGQVADRAERIGDRKERIYLIV